MSKEEKMEPLSTYDELMKDPHFKKDYDKSYRQLVLSELILAIMAEDHISIRSLAAQVGISPTIIQDLRSGKRDNITLKTFTALMDALGYDLVLENRENKKNLPKRVKLNKAGSRRIQKRLQKKVVC